MNDCPIEKLTFYAKSHAYYVKLRGEKSARWSGASAWGKQIESTDNLTRWKVVTALTGAATEPTLLRRFTMAQTRDEQDNAIEALLGAAKAHEGRDYGKDAHRVTELYDQGRLTVTDEWTDGIVQRWSGAIAAAEVTIDPLLVERVVLVPEFHVCATYDRIGAYKGEPHVVDLKTGTSGTKYAHTMCVQLAIIANAEWMASGPGETKGDATVWTMFERPPAMNRERGLIVSMPKDADTAEVCALDLVAGWGAAHLSHKARIWTRSDPAAVISTFTLGRKHEPADPAADRAGVVVDVAERSAAEAEGVACPSQPLSQPQTTIVADAANGSPVGTANAESLTGTTAATSATSAESGVPNRLADLYGYTYRRCLATLRHGDQAATDLADTWPAGVPSFAEARDAGYTHTAAELELILGAIALVDMAHRVAFPDEDDPRAVVAPGSEPVELAFIAPLKPEHLTGPPPDEGEPVGEDVLDEVRAAQDALTDEQFDLLGSIVEQAHGQVSLTVRPSARRVAIARALIEGVRFGQLDVIEAAVAYALGTTTPEVHAHGLGAWVARLTAAQAFDVRCAFKALDRGDLVISFDEWGEMPKLVAVCGEVSDHAE